MQCGRALLATAGRSQTFIFVYNKNANESHTLRQQKSHPNGWLSCYLFPFFSRRRFLFALGFGRSHRRSSSLGRCFWGSFGQRFLRSCAGGNCPNQALRRGSDQILSVGLQKRFTDQIIVLGIAILDQRSLHSLLMGVCGHIDLFHSPGIKSRVVHHRG